MPCHCIGMPHCLVPTASGITCCAYHGTLPVCHPLLDTPPHPGPRTTLPSHGWDHTHLPMRPVCSFTLPPTSTCHHAFSLDATLPSPSMDLTCHLPFTCLLRLPAWDLPYLYMPAPNTQRTEPKRTLPDCWKKGGEGVDGSGCGGLVVVGDLLPALHTLPTQTYIALHALPCPWAHPILLMPEPYLTWNGPCCMPPYDCLTFMPCLALPPCPFEWNCILYMHT